MSKKAQTALEFIFMFSFMFLLFIGMMAALSTRLNDAKKNNEETIIRNLQDIITQEIKLANIVENGYIREFQLPATINGEEYEIKIENKMTLIITINEKEFIKILQFNIEGEINKGKNIIKKNDDVILINEILL